jgi:citrate synthase
MTDTKDVSDWWRTRIIEMEPGHIALRGEPIQSLIGTMGFAEMIWFLVMGERISGPRADLFEAALVAAVDHGPQAPSIGAARMAATCGIGLQGSMATGLNMLGDVHGGAGEQAVTLFQTVDQAGLDSLRATLDEWRASNGKYLPGFGHRFHTPVDPRAPRLLELVEETARLGAVSGRGTRKTRSHEH